MKTKLIVLLSGVLSIGAVATASAADMAVKAARAPVVVATWTGCYIGVNGGWARSQVDAQWDANPVGFGAVPAATFNTLSASRHTADGGTIGGQIGCNWQKDRWVIGIEADGNWVDMGTHRDVNFTPNFNAGTATLTEDYRTRAFGTIRGRIGLLVTPTWLLYVTGGGAWANFRFNDCETAGATLATCSTNPANGGTGYNLANVDETRFGWAAGVGAETKFGANWSLKAEYLYMGFGNHSVNAPFTNFPGFAFNPATTNIVFNHNNLNIQTVRVGLNYHFGGPVVAKY